MMRALLFLLVFAFTPPSISAQTADARRPANETEEKAFEEWDRQEQQARQRAEERRQRAERQEKELRQRPADEGQQREEANRPVQVFCPPCPPQEEQQRTEPIQEEAIPYEQRVVPTQEEYEQQPIPGYGPAQDE